MAVNLTIELSRQINLTGDYDRIFDDLANVPVMASIFPKVDQVVEMGENIYRWEMEKTGLSKWSVQVIYACKYTNNKEEGWMKWEPVEGVGNARNRGMSKLTRTADGVRIDFQSALDMELPLPKLAKSMVKPLVIREMNSSADQFEKNLKKHFAS